MASWTLDPDVTHLNHGSFGACPSQVLDVQAEFQAQMERNPVAFMLHTYQPALERSRAALADFVGADTDGFVFVQNATYGVNSVLRSLEHVLPQGGEILLTDHTYNACRNAAEVTAAQIGGSIRVAEIPFPIDGPDTVVDAVMAAITDKTVLVMLDHVTSATGIVLPVVEITARLEPDIPVLIDGAHAPGMLPVDLQAIGASFYTANCHKWLCSPKGAAFLHVAERHRDQMHAAVVSHGYNNGWPNSGSRFHALFDWTGTDDPSARLSVATALQVMDDHHPQGWEGIRQQNHRLVLEGRDIVAAAMQVAPPAPDSMIGSIAALPVPTPATSTGGIFDELTLALHDTWAIEVPVFTWPEAPHRLLRVSAQQYNTREDYERLAHALASEL
jgi:isopenicillin-N epimerase